MDRSRVRRIAVRTALGGLGVFAAIQLVPYGWWHDNPTVTLEAPWPDAGSADIARESCYSCHSNETDWPVYSYVAPFSWLVRRDVESGRDELNFSTWDRDEGEADDAIESIVDGSMPPDRYTAIHRGARLTDDEIDVLVEALARLDAGEEGGSGSGEGRNGADRR